ncbi:MAG: hypothetical protein GY794_01980, partial [bacterium]|nr:hypothetical protein [bacterium]
MDNQWEKLEAEMQQLPLDALSDETRGRILEQVAASEKPVLLRWVAGAAAMAACAVIAVGIWAMSSGPADSPPIAQTPAG